MQCDFKQLIESLTAAGLNWDFYEDAAVLEDVREGTISGQIISHVDRLAGPRAVGLLVAFAARRSLACWFLYCTDTRPLATVDALIQHWLVAQNAPVPSAWLTPIKPMQGNRPIVDCRYSDTMSASSAVTHAAKFAASRNLLDAMMSLACSHTAFDCSPVGSTRTFAEWLTSYAIPIAVPARAMTAAESLALADFETPTQFDTKT